MDTIHYVLAGVIALFVVIVFFHVTKSCACKKRQAQAHHHKLYDANRLLPKHDVQSAPPVAHKFCDACLQNSVSKGGATVSAANESLEKETPVDFRQKCQELPLPNPDLAEAGTVGAPAFEGSNEFPAPFKQQCGECKRDGGFGKFNPNPADEHDDVYGAVDYQTQPRCAVNMNYKSCGVGEPANEKYNEFHASV